MEWNSINILLEWEWKEISWLDGMESKERRRNKPINQPQSINLIELIVGLLIGGEPQLPH